MGVFIIGLVLIFGGAAVDKQMQLSKLEKCVQKRSHNAKRCLR